MTREKLALEARRMTELLEHRVVKRCVRNKAGELVLFFEDGARLFVNAKSDLDFSITGLEDAEE